MQKYPKYHAAEILPEGGVIQEGCIPDSDKMVIVATVGSPDVPEPESKVIFFKEDGFHSFDVKQDSLLSVAHDATGYIYCLGRDGSLVKFSYLKADTREDILATVAIFENEKAFELGPLSRVIVVEGRPVYFGAFGQVYFLEGDALRELPFLEIYDDDIIIEDMWGPTFDNLVAITMEGHAAAFDGQTWTDLELPTNLPLSAITPLANGNLAICGHGSNIFVGRGSAWVAAPQIDPEERNYYGIAALGSDIYASHSGGIDIYNGDEIIPLVVPDGENFEFAYLRAERGAVWAFSGETVGKITDRTWETVIEPSEAHDEN